MPALCSAGSWPTHGETAFDGEPWRLFPSAETLTGARSGETADAERPRAQHHRPRRGHRRRQLVLDSGADRDELRSALLAMPGIGPWTADYLRMRTIGDPDVLLATDLGVRRAAGDLGVDLTGGRPDWAPWRSYATYHLWAHRIGDAWALAR